MLQSEQKKPSSGWSVARQWACLLLVGASVLQVRPIRAESEATPPMELNLTEEAVPPPVDDSSASANASPVIRALNATVAEGPKEEAPPSEKEASTPPAEDSSQNKPAEKPEPEQKEEEAPAWSLLNLFDDECGKNCLRDNQFNLGGNTVQSFTVNFNSPHDRFNGPVTWTDRSNDYQLNQQWLFFERTTKTEEGKDWDIGGRADFMYGTNARWSTATGLEDDLNRDHSFYAIAFPQLYGEIAYKSVKVKAGHFVSPVGYFTVDTTQNFFNTLPYTYQYGEPFTHTGMLATWAVDEQFSVGSGFTRGWDSFNRSNPLTSPNLGYLGTLSWMFDKETKSTLNYVNHWSNEYGGQGGTFTSRYHQTLVLTLNLTEKLTYVGQSDFSVQDAAASRTIGSARWYGLNQYLFQKINDQWSLGFNFEWFRDESGFRVGGLLPSNPPSEIRGLPLTRNSYAGNFYQVTLGPKWQPTKNLFLRPNVRVDWFDGDVRNAGGLKPFDDGTKNSQVIFGTDLVVTY